mgnify:FL=1
MKNKWVKGLGLLALLGCGGADETLSHVSIRFDELNIPGVSQYDVHIFGGGISCDSALSDPSTHLTQRKCEVAEAETATDCHIRRLNVQPGSRTRLESISPGRRAVFVLGMDDNQQNLAKGCTAIDVKAGAVSSATVSVVAF